VYVPSVQHEKRTAEKWDYLSDEPKIGEWMHPHPHFGPGLPAIGFKLEQSWSAYNPRMPGGGPDGFRALILRYQEKSRQAWPIETDVI
jgi:hypothetical protein